jgi:hypothetical protein
MAALGFAQRFKKTNEFLTKRLLMYNFYCLTMQKASENIHFLWRIVLNAHL